MVCSSGLLPGCCLFSGCCGFPREKMATAAPLGPCHNNKWPLTSSSPTPIQRPDPTHTQDRKSLCLPEQRNAALPSRCLRSSAGCTLDTCLIPFCFNLDQGSDRIQFIYCCATQIQIDNEISFDECSTDSQFPFRHIFLFYTYFLYVFLFFF